MLPKQASCCSASLGFDGQTVQLPNHEIHHIIGVILGANAIQVPTTIAHAP